MLQSLGSQRAGCVLATEQDRKLNPAHQPPPPPQPTQGDSGCSENVDALTTQDDRDGGYNRINEDSMIQAAGDLEIIL